MGLLSELGGIIALLKGSVLVALGACGIGWGLLERKRADLLQAELCKTTAALGKANESAVLLANAHLQASHQMFAKLIEQRSDDDAA